jgi:nucleotide-binding universal stress UspA family protein
VPILDWKVRAALVLKNILVPLDGSPLAEAALPFATAIGARAGARLTLVRAAMYRTLFSDVAAEQVRAIQDGEDYLARTAGQLRAKGVSVSSRVPLGGSPAEWIVDETEVVDADLIVMATHDRERLDRWVRGSVAEAVVHGSTVPVMLVRGAADAQLAQRFETNTPALLVPLDGSELADAALPAASQLAAAIGARVVLVAVVPRPGQLVAGSGGAITTYAGAEHAALEAEARAYLRARAQQLEHVACIDTVVCYGGAAAEISTAAEQYTAAAVVMTTHGRTGLVRSLLGSVAGAVLHGTTVPVVVIRPTGSSAAVQIAPGSAVAGQAS